MKISGLPLVSALLCLASLVILIFCYIQYSFSSHWDEAQALEENGSSEEALESYQNLADRLRRFPLLRTQFEAEYSAAMIGQLRVLYNAQNYDQVIELAETCVQEDLEDIAAAHYWSGNALFQRGVNEEVGEDSFSWFHQSMAQFKKGLENDTEGRWNLRFNYELVKTAIEEAEQNQEEKPLNLLRPQDPVQTPAEKVVG